MIRVVPMPEPVQIDELPRVTSRVLRVQLTSRPQLDIRSSRKTWFAPTRMLTVLESTGANELTLEAKKHCRLGLVSDLGA